jgi:hypothetical protein
MSKRVFGALMKPEEILNHIAEAGAWLPTTIVRQAFGQHDALTSALLGAIKLRADAKHGQDIRTHRLAAFGIFLLAQLRDHRLLDPLIGLLETTNPEQEDEWLFLEGCFSLAIVCSQGVCPLNVQRLKELALDPALKPLTRSLAVCAIGLLAAYGDITRAEAVRRMRATYSAVRTLKSEWTDACWARTAVRLHSKEFERELEWFLASGRLPHLCQKDIAGAMRIHPDTNFLFVAEFDPMVDLSSNVFLKDIRDGEVGLLPNGQIPGLGTLSWQRA